MIKDKKIDNRELFAIILIGCFFIFIHSLSLLLIGPFEAGGLEPVFENPDDPTNILLFFFIIMVITVAVLLIAKYWKKKLIQIIIVGAVGYTAAYMFYLVFALFTTDFMTLVFSLISAFILIVVILKHPE